MRHLHRLVIVSGLLGSVACGSAGTPAGDGTGFTPARLVSADTENGATPMFAATPAGERVLAWVSAPGGGENGRLHVQVTAPDGTAREATVVDPLGPIEPHGESPPQLVAGPDGSIYAQYAVGKLVPGRRFPVSALRFVRSTDGGRSWSAPVTINDAGAHGEFGAHNFHALTSAPGGVLLSTWLDSRQGSSGVWMSRSTDGGRTWAPNRAIESDPSCPCCRTGVSAAADGRLYVSWRTILPGDVRDVVVSRSTDDGATWSEPVRPREDGWVFPGCPHAGPSMRVDDAGRVHIAWWTGKAGEAGIWYARSDDGGERFSAQPIAIGDRSAPAHVQLALAPDGRVLLAWDDGRGAIPQVLLRESSDGGVTFAPPVALSDAGRAATFPVLLVTRDSVAVAWSEVTTEEHHARAAARPDMKDPTATMPLPRVGQSEIWIRSAPLVRTVSAAAPPHPSSIPGS